MTTFAEAWNKLPRRVEGDGRIRWFVENVCQVDVSLESYYREGHVHPKGCACDALVHDDVFQSRLRRLGF